MKFNKLYFKEYKDMFNYYNLIRKINNNYRLFFNLKNRKYYVVNLNKNNEICMEFNQYFKNILFNLRFYNIANLNKVLSKIENYNSNLENKKLNQSLEKTKYSLNETLKLSMRSNKINNNDLNKIIGVK